jgi:hypothetical protein
MAASGREQDQGPTHCSQDELRTGGMPRYFFDTYDGNHASLDEEGVECGSRQQIQDCAIDALPDIARDELPDGLEQLFWVKVRDESGRLVFEASLTLTSRWLAEEN